MAFCLGKLELPSRFSLSPLAGYTNWPFRRAVRELGGLGLATTELVNARALMRGSRKSLEFIETCPLDRPLAVQIYGAVAQEMADAARWLEEFGASAVDINMGCPVNKVTRGGGGSAMMCDANGTVNLVRAVVEAVRIPVTVKMRLGWDDANLSAPFFARQFEEVGVAGIIVHGRTRAQGFGGQVSLNGIRAVVDAVQRIPIIGNGDIRTLDDAIRMFEVTGCAGIAIGRGALLNPWIFAQLSQWDAACGFASDHVKATGNNNFPISRTRASGSPLPRTRGRGVGGEGEEPESREEALSFCTDADSPPHPRPSPPSTGERGAGIGRSSLKSEVYSFPVPRPQATYDDRLDFMARHFHLLVGQRDERFACLTFRKVANWYCRVLKPGRDMQRQFMLLESVVQFDDMVDHLRHRGPPAHWHRDMDLAISVPRGPNERW